MPTRIEALRRIESFVPRAGRAYAAGRNNDRGRDDRANVSMLSPYLRHRVVAETELLEAVLARHSLSAAEKFVQEVFWRTYWKGWLETHPAAWSRYRVTLSQAIAERDATAALAAAYADAVGARTGIDAFDAWARELVETNYLHNHARMWFASIWIFTLRLPWELGADFFMRHLLDGDPASNTLSWRWVAGLQTRGKTYRATRENIRRYTGDRFTLAEPLAQTANALDDAPIPLVPLVELPFLPRDEQPTLLVVHDDDLLGDISEHGAGRGVSDIAGIERRPELGESAGGKHLIAGDLGRIRRGLRGVCGISAVAGRSPEPMSAAVPAFVQALGADAVGRIAALNGAADLGFHAPADAAEARATIATAAARCGATRIVAPYAPIGPVRDLLCDILATGELRTMTSRELQAAGEVQVVPARVHRAAGRLQAPAGGEGQAAAREMADSLGANASRHLEVSEFGRGYDRLSWPAATRGFFNVRARIPTILAELGIGAG
jgi:deoxyribodipyrimidine photo-lyase